MMRNESVQLLLSSTALSVALVWLVRWDARRRGLIDRPNARSSHVAPTPRGGGLGLLLALGLALAIELARDGRSLSLTAVLTVAAVAAVGLIGWVDDHGGAPVRLRLVVHLVAGLLLLPLALSAELPIPIWLAIGWWILWTISAVNVVNFIDGIDGIIGLQVIIYGGFVSLLGAPGGMVQESGVAFMGASIGFLVWNWSPARIFMGDVGSGAIGVILVALGAALIAEGRVGFVAAFAPLAPIFLDASLTLVHRARRGERLSEAHRSHLYQRLANGGWGHARVAFLYAAMSTGAAVAACLAPRAGLLLLGALLVPLAFLYAAMSTGAAVAACLAPRAGLLLLGALLVPLAFVWVLLERRAAPTRADPPMLP